MKLKELFVIPAVLLTLGIATQTKEALADTLADQNTSSSVSSNNVTDNNDVKPEVETQQTKMTPVSFVGKVNYRVGGKVNIWQLNDGKVVNSGKQVNHAASYKVFGYTEVNGMKYYNLGGNQWIQGQYLLDRATNKPVVAVPNNPTQNTTKPGNSETPTKPLETTKESFVGQVHYRVGGKVNIWAINDSKLTYTGKQVNHGAHFKVFASTTLNSKKYFNLGGNQWIESTYLSKQNSAPTTHVGGVESNETIAVKPGTTLSVVGYVPKYGIAVFQRNGEQLHAIPNKTLKNGTSWKVFSRAVINGKLYFNVGGNQWVSSQYVVVGNPRGTSIKLSVPYVSQYAPIRTPWGCASAALAMLLKYDGVNITTSTLKYMQDNLPRWPYVVGGQKGDPYTGAGFGWVINSKALTDYGHRWSDKVRDISGANAEIIKNLVLSGHPVLYYGWSPYQDLRTDLNRNHCKVIVGFQNNQFIIQDPLAWPDRPGNTYSRSIAQFNREYAGNALTI